MKHSRCTQWLVLMGCVICLAVLASTATAFADTPFQVATPTAASSQATEAERLTQDGVALYGQGKLKEALDQFTQALGLYRAAADRKGEGIALGNLGAVYRSLGEPQQALHNLEQALAIARELHDQEDEGSVLGNLGAVYGDAGQFDKALENYQQALAIARNVHDRANEAVTLNNIGAAYRNLGQPDKALDYYQQALTVAEAEDDLSSQGTTLSNMGLAYALLGQPDKALGYYERALKIQGTLHDLLEQGATLEHMGSLYADLGQTDKALENYEQALAIDRDVHNRRAEGTTLGNIGSLYGDLGQPDKALDYYQQALTVHREVNDPVSVSGTLRNMAAIYSGLGQPQKALDNYGQALEIARSVHDRAGEGTILRDAGWVYANMGQPAKGLENLEQALAIAREVHSRPDEGGALLAIGEVYRGLQQLDKALESDQQALAIAREVRARRMEGVSLNNIGLTYSLQGELQKALNSYQQVLPIRRAVGDRGGEAATLNNIGAVYYKLGQPQSALESWQQALDLERTIGNRSGEGTLLGNIASAYETLGQPQQMRNSAEQALAIARQLGDPSLAATTSINVGISYEQEGNLTAALASYRQAIMLTESIRTEARLDELKTSLTAGFAPIYERTALLLLRLNQPAEAFNLTERARARTFLDQLGNPQLDVHRDTNSQLLAEAQSQLHDLAALDQALRQESARPGVEQHPETLESLKAQVADKEKAYEDLLTRLKLANPEYASLVSVDPLTLPEVQALLDRNTTLVSYFVTAGQTLAFVVTHDRLDTVPLAVKGQELGAAIDESRNFASLDAPSPRLRQLYDWLIAPLKTYLNTPVLAVVPHGKLHYLPFAALTADGKTYLGDQYTVTYLPSASALRFVEQKRKSAAEGEVLAVAYAAPAGLSRLAYADSEAKAIAQLYQTTALTGRQATKSAVSQHAPTTRILHLAAHAELNPDHPIFSRIFLADAPGTDGSLTLQDVYGLDLRQADLVVLSACETQLGAQSLGDDIVGLNRAFIYAGAPSVIASLWKVDDQATSELMTSFYEHLHAGAGKAEALRTAQAEMRAKRPHPYYWAAFVLTGDPGIVTGMPSAAGQAIERKASGPSDVTQPQAAVPPDELKRVAAIPSEFLALGWSKPVLGGLVGLGGLSAIAALYRRRRQK